MGWLVEVLAMTDPEGIQREPTAPTPTAGPAKCPHCDKSLTQEDVAGGRCWYCGKGLTDPVEPRPPHTPFLAIFLLGFVGAGLGLAAGYLLTGERMGSGSWTVSLCGGI